MSSYSKHQYCCKKHTCPSCSALSNVIKADYISFDSKQYIKIMLCEMCEETFWAVHSVDINFPSEVQPCSKCNTLSNQTEASYVRSCEGKYIRILWCKKCRDIFYVPYPIEPKFLFSKLAVDMMPPIPKKRRKQ